MIETSFSLLGSKLRDLRIEKKMSQAELGDGIVTRNMVCRIEKGQVLPSLPVICALAQRLDVPVGYFLNDYDDGSEYRKKRLLELIAEEYHSGQYESCLKFCESYGEASDEIIHISSECYYKVGIESLILCDLKKAQMMFGKPLALAEKTSDKLPEVDDCRMFIVMTDVMRDDPDISNFENLCKKVIAENSDNFFSRFCRFYLLIKNDFQTAEKAYESFPFGDKLYADIALGLLRTSTNPKEANKIFLKVMSDNLLPPLKIIVLSELEKYSAESKNFEYAYIYSNKLNSLIDEIKKS